eukprot:20533-Heterococcus_DN1.PRE.1
MPSENRPGQTVVLAGSVYSVLCMLLYSASALPPCRSVLLSASARYRRKRGTMTAPSQRPQQYTYKVYEAYDWQYSSSSTDLPQLRACRVSPVNTALRSPSTRLKQLALWPGVLHATTLCSPKLMTLSWSNG